MLIKSTWRSGCLSMRTGRCMKNFGSLGKVRAKVINYTPDVDFYWKELMQRMEECEEAERRQAEDMERSEDKVEVNLKDKEQPVRLWAFPVFNAMLRLPA